MPGEVLLTRIEQFSAAHRLFVRDLSDEENLKIFDKCSWENGHGHNYKVEVRVKGKVNQQTGMVMDIGVLKREIQSVLEQVDHKFLDKDVPFFADKPSTVENICIFFWEALKSKLPTGVKMNKVKVYETEKNVAAYKG